MFKMSNLNTLNVIYLIIIPEKCTKSAANRQKLGTYRKSPKTVF